MWGGQFWPQPLFKRLSPDGADLPIDAKSRLKAGRSQDWLPHLIYIADWFLPPETCLTGRRVYVRHGFQATFNLPVLPNQRAACDRLFAISL
jgi:hypothetical protein